MNVDEFVRDTLREQAGEQRPVAPGFADRVLAVRRRRRTRRLAAVAAAVAIAVAVPLVDSRWTEVLPASVVGPEKDSVMAHPDQSPPRDMIAAGRTALAAYYTLKTVKHGADRAVSTRTYWLLNPKTRKYEKTTKWSVVAVAPGLRTAAVLEQGLPAHRIGLLDLASGQIKRWISVDHPVGGLAFSRDGTKIVATGYGGNPDARYKIEGVPDWQTDARAADRNGFLVIDVASGSSSWAEVDRDTTDPNSRQDFAFSRDGRFVWTGTFTEPGYQYFDRKGNKVEAPLGEGQVPLGVAAGLSPDGKRVAGDFAGERMKTSSWILDPRTGQHVTEVHGQQLLSWADDNALIAWDMGGKGNEFHNHLVLVTIGSDKVVPLSGFRMGNDGASGRWTPVFADR
ncbi:WD40 repeat domain-containing protein [Streptomyces sp. NPDC003656]|uniref:WD40 repeat domain-containing protein n=1 Tax=Streptomyces sp. NPDC091385 TaxID=3365997 RepID=UPI0037F961FD